jgi:hypothetical protein
VVVNSAGCGALLKDYGHLLGTAEGEAFGHRVRDVSELLADAGPVPAESFHSRSRTTPLATCSTPSEFRLRRWPSSMPFRDSGSGCCPTRTAVVAALASSPPCSPPCRERFWRPRSRHLPKPRLGSISWLLGIQAVTCNRSRAPSRSSPDSGGPPG